MSRQVQLQHWVLLVRALVKVGCREETEVSGMLGERGVFSGRYDPIKASVIAIRICPGCFINAVTRGKP